MILNSVFYCARHYLTYNWRAHLLISSAHSPKSKRNKIAKNVSLSFLSASQAMRRNDLTRS